MDQIQSISQHFSGQGLHQVALLRLVRVHPGIWMEQKEGKASVLLRSRRANYDTNAIDVLMILLRHLTSFGYAIDTGSEKSETEVLLLRVVDLNLGWEQAQDWHAKRAIYNNLFGTELPSEEIRFESLRGNEKLANLFSGNEQFRLVRPVSVIRKLDGSTSVEPMWQEGEDIRSQNITWRGNVTLSYRVESLFSVQMSPGQRIISARPKFLEIKYERLSDRPSIPIVEMRILEFEAAEYRQGRMGRQRPVYHLCAVLRKAQGQGDIDRLRTYWKDGSEAIPAEIGSYKQKEPEAENEKHWSVEEPGIYLLYFYRLYRNILSLQSDMNIDAKEYEERPWVLRERQGI